MKKILTIARSISETRALAEDIATSKGETIKLTDKRETIETDQTTYYFIPLHSIKMEDEYRNVGFFNGGFEEVYIIGTISLQEYEKIKALIVPHLIDPKTEIKIIEVEAQNFKVK